MCSTEIFYLYYKICQYQLAAKLMRINISYMQAQRDLCSVHHFCCMCCATYGTLLKFKRIKKQAQQLADMCGEPKISYTSDILQFLSMCCV